MKDVLKIYAKKGNYGWFAVVDNGKKDDNERVIYFMELAFKQGNEPAVSPCRLDIGHCFLSCYPSKAGIKPKLVITEYEIEKAFENLVMPYDPYAQGGMGVSYSTVDSLSDEDIPF